LLGSLFSFGLLSSFSFSCFLGSLLLFFPLKLVVGFDSTISFLGSSFLTSFISLTSSFSIFSSFLSFFISTFSSSFTFSGFSSTICSFFSGNTSISLASAGALLFLNLLFI
jgi:hypothetical protein